MPRVSNRWRGGQAGPGVQTGYWTAVGGAQVPLRGHEQDLYRFGLPHHQAKCPGDGSGQCLRAQAADRRDGLQGVELEGRVDLTSRWDLALSYTSQDMEITRDTTSLQGKTPVWVPKQMASLWSNYLPAGTLAGARLGAGLRYVGRLSLMPPTPTPCRITC